MKLHLVLDVDADDFLYGGLADVLACIGNTIQDAEQSAHPRTPIMGLDRGSQPAKRFIEIGHWEVK